MNVLNLRACTLTNKYYTFSIKDIPVLVDDNNFILMARPGSPILRFDTIGSLTDIPDIGEGTVLVGENNDVYTISFKRGFAAMSSDRQISKLHELSNYTITAEAPHFVGIANRQRLLFKYNNLQFQIKDIVGAIDGKAIVKREHTLVAVDKVQQYAGLTFNNTRVFLGDVIDGGIVTMYKGRVCLHKNNRYIDLTDMQEIGRS